MSGEQAEIDISSCWKVCFAPGGRPVMWPARRAAQSRGGRGARAIVCARPFSCGAKRPAVRPHRWRFSDIGPWPPGQPAAAKRKGAGPGFHTQAAGRAGFRRIQDVFAVNARRAGRTHGFPPRPGDHPGERFPCLARRAFSLVCESGTIFHSVPERIVLAQLHHLATADFQPWGRAGLVAAPTGWSLGDYPPASRASRSGH